MGEPDRSRIDLERIDVGEVILENVRKRVAPGGTHGERERDHKEDKKPHFNFGGHGIFLVWVVGAA
jgi:hypothetical protein